jgi:prepilin-type processing-associated H-X9-DG protein
MRKSLRFLLFGTLGMIGVLAGHLVYLYHHREFGPPDFRHPFILGLQGHMAQEEKAKISPLLKQKFVYLGSGTQVTAFESEDHRYVIKFFNPRNTIKKDWFHRFSRLRLMSSVKWIAKTYLRKQERLLKFFKSHELAFRDLREESGILYLHFDRSSCLGQKMELVDQDGKLHLVDLDVCPFILQKKVEIAMTHLNERMAKGDIEGAKKGIEQIYQLFLSRAQKGYTDHRQSLSKNYGFADGHAVQLDVGRIRHDDQVKQLPLKDLERIVSNLAPSLPPELASFFQECLEESKKSLSF